MRTYYNNGYYIGDVNRNGEKHGKGTYYWNDGDRYEGDWRDGKMNGKGTYYWNDGDRYEGDFRDGKKNGKGTYYYANGDRCEGDWCDNKMHGKGTCYYANGERYEGDFRDDKRTGKGTYYWNDGDRYEGDFRDGKRTGKGTYYWNDGDRYEGDFRDGKRNGKGTYYYANGNRYEGDWHDSKRNGKGTYYYADGRIEEREYANGTLVNSQVIKENNQNKTVGRQKSGNQQKLSFYQGKYVFISYSSKNQEYAEAMRHLLDEEQIQNWMAPYDIPAGSKYAHVINDAIEQCSCVLLLLSEQSQASEWVEKEIERAVTYRKTIISMHIDESKLNSGFRFYLGNQQIVPVRTINKSNANVKKILTAIRTFVN